MSWDHYYIFVKGPRFDKLELNAILARLNLVGYKAIEEVTLAQTNKQNVLFAGFYDGNLMLVQPELVEQFFNEGQSDDEKLFIRVFPDSEIAALIINESVGLFGFAIIVNGKKIRMKMGCGGKYYYDLGKALPEESEVASEQIYNPEDLENMKKDGMSDEAIEAQIKFEASWRVPNELTKRYLGVPVLACDPYKIRLTKYERG